MSISAIVAQLESLVNKAESVAESICQIKVCQPKELYLSLELLNRRLQEAATKVAGRIERLEEGRAERIRQEGGIFLSQAGKIRESIIQTNQVKSISLFRKNMVLIFQGPKASALDSGWTKSKNNQNRRRCELIRQLNPDGLLSWATAMAPSIWTAGCMQNDIFDYLIEEIEPENAQLWPLKIADILHVFGTEESLAHSQEYQTFLEGEVGSIRSIMKKLTSR